MIYIIQKDDKFIVGMDVQYKRRDGNRSLIFKVWYSPCGCENWTSVLAIAKLLDEESAYSVIQWIKLMHDKQAFRCFFRVYGNDVHILDTVIAMAEVKDGNIVHRRVL